MKQQCGTFQQQSAKCRSITLSDDSSFEGSVMPHYNRDDYSSGALSDYSSFEGFVMPHYNRDDYSSVSSEEDCSISKEESNHSTIDTTLISTYSDEFLFPGDTCVHDMAVSNVSAELSCEEEIDFDALSRMVGPVTVQNGKRTKKNEEMKCQKKDEAYDPTCKEHMHTEEILPKEQKQYLADTVEKIMPASVMQQRT
eukprot:1269038-Ditylum_brightwellii.AAC.1